MTTRAGNTKPRKRRKRRKDAGQPKELTEEHKRKMQEARERKRKEREQAQKVNLRETVKSLRDRVTKAEKEDAKALGAFERAKSDKNFNAWMRANSILLNTVTALKAHEERLEHEA